MIDLSWSVVKEMAGWAASAHSAAKTRQQQRYANLVEHAGILVAGANFLNRQFLILLRPLVFFDPNEWTKEQRAERATDLILFCDESVVVPRIRTSRSALRPLLVEVTDVDIRSPAVEILDMADMLFVGDGAVGWSTYGDDLGNTGAIVAYAATDLHRVIEEYEGDTIMQEALPEVLHLLRNARTSADMIRLRRRAEILTDIRVEGWHGITRETEAETKVVYSELPGRSVIAPYAAPMQAAFGRLLGALQRVFPGLPSPTWAF